MALSRFNIIVCTDAVGGIAKDNDIPWMTNSDYKFFRETTIGGGNGRNAIIMGRKTWETIPESARPLQDRKNIIVSNTLSQEVNGSVCVCRSLLEALSTASDCDATFLNGGEELYREAIDKFLYLVDTIIITKYKIDYNPDKLFPLDIVSKFQQSKDPIKTRDYTRLFYSPKQKHQECVYLDLLSDILNNGELKSNRTNVSVFEDTGRSLSFDLSKGGFPLLTTKRVSFDNILNELLFFISGKTDTTILEAQGCKIWKGNTSREFLDSRGLVDLEVGDMGLMYGYQWRNFNGSGIDQLGVTIKEIQEDPYSRRHIVTALNPCNYDKGVLLPCHFTFQFMVSGCGSFLDCVVYQRSADLFLGVPYNIASYSLLLVMVSHLTGKKPRKISFMFGHAHIYSTHTTQVRKQIQRSPRPFPTLRLVKTAKLKSVDDFTRDNFVLDGYEPLPFLPAEMAI